ncbi:MAG: polyprenyl synthetase family protein [Flavobacteriia bacterium]|nr:polyprenyl synthetase family protein [Flavobacteriia bacterium]
MNAVERLQRLFLQSLEQGFGEPEWNRQPDSLYAPQRYILSMGGKRLRPVLSLMAAEALGAPAEQALPAAHAVERFHNFSLIHDDIMDEAPVRRGKPTVHMQWGLNTAILSGDALLVMAYESLRALPAETLPQALKVFNRTALEVCEGQQWDMEFETQDQVHEGQYLQMIRYKTSVLLGCALELGAAAASASSEVASACMPLGWSWVPPSKSTTIFWMPLGTPIRSESKWEAIFGATKRPCCTSICTRIGLNCWIPGLPTAAMQRWTPLKRR